MSTENSTFQVFTLHDPRKSDGASCVYVGVTHRSDLETCVGGVIRQQFADLTAELQQDADPTVRQLDARLHGDGLTKDVALMLKRTLIADFRDTGSAIKHGRQDKPRLFKLTRLVAAIPAAASQ